MTQAEGHDTGGMKTMYWVWIGLIVLTLLEVFLAYKQVPLHIMLIALIGMSLLKAALIVAYFMHLKFEKRSLVLTLIPAVTACILLLNVVFPDSFRLVKMGTDREEASSHVESEH